MLYIINIRKVSKGFVMKFFLMILVSLISINSFSETMFCGVYLINRADNQVLAHKLMEQSLRGASAGNHNGSDFYNEKTKKRFFKKQLITSQIVFADMLNVEPNSAIFQFYRLSNPNRYGILTTSEKIGSEILVRVGEEKMDIIDDKYIVKSYCNIKS